MKNIYLVGVMVFISINLYSQSSEGTVNFKKNKETAAILEVPFSTDVVNASLNEYLSKKGRSKETDARGFTAFRNTQSVSGDSINADLYFKVERKDKQSSTISLLVTDDATTSTTASPVNNMSMEQAKAYLDELVPVIESYNLELLINQQNDAIIKAESKYKSVQNDVESLNKKKLSVEHEIEETKREMLKLANETDQQKQKLAELVRRRKM